MSSLFEVTSIAVCMEIFHTCCIVGCIVIPFHNIHENGRLLLFCFLGMIIYNIYTSNYAYAVLFAAYLLVLCKLLWMLKKRPDGKNYRQSRF